MGTALTPEQRAGMARKKTERFYLELDTTLALNVLALPASTWITACERAGHILIADTEWCEECQRSRDTQAKVAPPEIARGLDGRRLLVSFLVRYHCRVACTYEAEPVGSRRVSVFGHADPLELVHTEDISGELRVLVDAVSKTGKLTVSFYGELNLEGAFLGIAALYMCGRTEQVRYYSDLLEAYVASHGRIRFDCVAHGRESITDVIVVHPAPDPRGPR